MLFVFMPIQAAWVFNTTALILNGLSDYYQSTRGAGKTLLREATHGYRSIARVALAPGR
jgi:hypothetical protein